MPSALPTPATASPSVLAAPNGRGPPPRSICERLGQDAASGHENREAVLAADIAFLVVPYDGQQAILEALTEAIGGRILISAVAPLTFEGGRPRAVIPSGGSAALEAQKQLSQASVTAAFHHLSARHLKDVEHHLEGDVLVSGNDAEAKRITMGLVSELADLRPVDAGRAGHRLAVGGADLAAHRHQPPLQGEQRRAAHRAVKGFGKVGPTPAATLPMATPLTTPSHDLRIIGLTTLPEVQPGDDLAALILAAAAREAVGLMADDVVAVTQKVVSKAEGRLVDLSTVTPSALARNFADQAEKDPRLVEVVLRETKRIVRMDKMVLIVETHRGFICANAGVDNSNVPGQEVVSLLPEDPDASAAQLRAAFREAAGVDTAVLITDSFGRPWREGITEVAIGVAGMLPVQSYRGVPDSFGMMMRTTEVAVADHLAAAAGLVTEKLARVPVVILRGASYPRGRGQRPDAVARGRAGPVPVGL